MFKFVRLLFLILIFFTLLSAALSVNISYQYPTPSQNYKVSNDSVTIRFGNGTQDISPCSVVFNGTESSATYSGGFCVYTHNFSVSSKTSYIFKASYNNGADNLSNRTITYFPTTTTVGEASALGIGSLITFLVTFALAFWGIIS